MATTDHVGCEVMALLPRGRLAAWLQTYIQQTRVESVWVGGGDVLQCSATLCCAVPCDTVQGAGGDDTMSVCMLGGGGVSCS